MPRVPQTRESLSCGRSVQQDVRARRARTRGLDAQQSTPHAHQGTGKGFGPNVGGLPSRRRPKGPVLAGNAAIADSGAPSPEGIFEGSFFRANRPDSLRDKIARRAADRRNRRNSRVTRHRRGNERNEQELPRGHLRLRARATGKWVSLPGRRTRPRARRARRRSTQTACRKDSPHQTAQTCKQGFRVQLVRSTSPQDDKTRAKCVSLPVTGIATHFLHASDVQLRI